MKPVYWKTRRNLLRLLPLALLPLLAMPLLPALGEDFGEIEDQKGVKEQAGLKPVAWEPIITRFFYSPRSDIAGGHRPGEPPPGGTTPPAPDDVYRTPLQVEVPPGQLPGLVASWQWLKPLIRFRGDEYFGKAFRDDEPVMSGWMRDKDGVSFLVHLADASPSARPPEDGKGPKSLMAIRHNTPGYLHMAFDVLMSEENPAKRDELLLKYFTLNRLEVNVYPVTTVKGIDAMLAHTRDATGKEPLDMLGLPLKRESVTWRELNGAFVRQEWLSNELIVRYPGICEFRVFVELSGRLNDNELPVTKSVEGSFRVAFDPYKVTIDRLNVESRRK